MPRSRERDPVTAMVAEPLQHDRQHVNHPAEQTPPPSYVRATALGCMFPLTSQPGSPAVRVAPSPVRSTVPAERLHLVLQQPARAPRGNSARPAPEVGAGEWTRSHDAKRAPMNLAPLLQDRCQCQVGTIGTAVVAPPALPRRRCPTTAHRVPEPDHRPHRRSPPLTAHATAPAPSRSTPDRDHHGRSATPWGHGPRSPDRAPRGRTTRDRNNFENRRRRTAARRSSPPAAPATQPPRDAPRRAPQRP